MNLTIEEKIKYNQLKTSTGKIIDYYEFEHHRFSLLAWYRTMLKNKGEAPYIIMVDRHRDIALASEERLSKFGVYSSEGQLFNNIEHYPVSGNFDFISYAMWFNFFSNMLLIAYEKYHDIEIHSMLPVEQALRDKSGNLHFITAIESLNEAFSQKSVLYDCQTYKKGLELLNKAQNIILDIDLDYFTYQSPDDGIYVRDESDIEKNFTLIKNKLNEIIEHKISTIVIAKESECCGGIENMKKIKKILTRLFRENFQISLPD